MQKKKINSKIILKHRYRPLCVICIDRNTSLQTWLYRYKTRSNGVYFGECIVKPIQTYQNISRVFVIVN